MIGSTQFSAKSYPALNLIPSRELSAIRLLVMTIPVLLLESTDIPI
jgi:hypothetical protein